MFNDRSHSRIVACLASTTALGFAFVVLAPAVLAGGHHDRPMKIKTCNSSNPCSGGNNLGSGVAVWAESATNDGLDAYTNNQSRSTGFARSGVWALDNSTDGGSLNRGLTAYSRNGYGVYAQSTGGTALSAYSTNWIGLVAQSDTGYPFLTMATPGNNELPLWVVSGMSDNQHDAIETYNSNGTEIMAVDDVGNVHITGKIYTAGGCSSGCSHMRDGLRRVVSYPPSESQPTMEDTGEARLVNGQAAVHIDPAFANVIDRGAGYSVLITPEGDNRGLYVTQKSPSGFEVRESQDGRSTLAFAYRIVAKPYGDASPRLPALNVRLNRKLPTVR